MAAKPKSPRKAKDTTSDQAAPVVNKKPVATEEGHKKMADAPSVIEFSEDIATAEAPAPLPTGQYTGEIRGAEVKTSNSTGNQYGAVQFFIAPEQYPADFDEGNPDGMILTFNRVSVQDNPASRHRMRKFCEAIGYSPKGGKVDMNDWIGLTATLDVTHDTYEGETRAQIARVVQP